MLKKKGTQASIQRLKDGIIQKQYTVNELTQKINKTYDIVQQQTAEVSTLQQALNEKRLLVQAMLYAREDIIHTNNKNKGAI